MRSKQQICGVDLDMIRNRKFHVYRDKDMNPFRFGDSREIPAPTLIWAKDLKDAQSILHVGKIDLKSVVIVEVKD